MERKATSSSSALSGLRMACSSLTSVLPCTPLSPSDIIAASGPPRRQVSLWQIMALVAKPEGKSSFQLETIPHPSLGSVVCEWLARKTRKPLGRTLLPIRDPLPLVQFVGAK